MAGHGTLSGWYQLPLDALSNSIIPASPLLYPLPTLYLQINIIVAYVSKITRYTGQPSVHKSTIPPLPPLKSSLVFDAKKREVLPSQHESAFSKWSLVLSPFTHRFECLILFPSCETK